MDLDSDRKQLPQLISNIPGLYDELKALAHTQLQNERGGHTLNTTALAHEAYIRLTQQDKLNVLDRRAFSIAAAAVIRRILVDYARGRRAQKRSHKGGQRIPLIDLIEDESAASVDLLDLNEALNELALECERAVRLVELRYFGGLTIAEAANALGISRRTAVNEWTMARGWLRRKLRDSANA